MDSLFQFGLAGLVSFGLVRAVSYVKPDLPSSVRLGLLVVVAFVIGYIPADLGADLFNRIRDAIGIGAGVNAGWAALKRVSGQE